MSETLSDIVAVPDRPGVSRWQAVVPGGSVAGLAALRSIIPFWHDLLPPPTAATRPGVPELTLYVEPEWRRRGIGSRLLATVRAHTAEPRLFADVAAGAPGEAFCLRHGFRHARSKRLDLLTYCDVHWAWLGEMVDAEPSGYRLIHRTGILPAMRRVEELRQSPSRTGDTVLTAAETDGDLAAYAVAVVGALSPNRARQYGPAVLPDHRGRRLGVWVNAALIQRLREVHPHVDEIETFTDEGDTHLLAVREHLGFRPSGRTRRYELALP
ncbi:GNAT superfamily N-acetyltransferase [Micromonospora luteifusca]|uniref:GNAT superfamily N-acetyltransferase n=1 Tax=Micromonospora luteifusca TaxID=709860 RepID=A0ABS2LNT7_9ACTN|nr:GNAT family N-acetyltransferase [Micromonospora luteifusca]MBM7489579.1 GNAT superfamily N-acetyltransferase [Micromonospora luteifusca]